MTEKKIAIVDDDPFVVAHLKCNLERRMPDVDVVGIVEPVAPSSTKTSMAITAVRMWCTGFARFLRTASFWPTPRTSIANSFAHYCERDARGHSTKAVWKSSTP